MIIQKKSVISCKKINLKMNEIEEKAEKTVIFSSFYCFQVEADVKNAQDEVQNNVKTIKIANKNLII